MPRDDDARRLGLPALLPIGYASGIKCFAGESLVERETIDWLPRSARKRVSLIGMAKIADERSVRVLVSNLSYQGCHVWSDHDFEPGEALTLYLPGYGDVTGQIRWQSAGRAGIRFLTGASAVDERRARLGV
jgi:hypothetical protein